MRVRKVRNSAARFEAKKHLLIFSDYKHPEKIDIKEYFPSYTRFRLEVGCGKGSYVTGEAKNHPDIAYVAVEKITDVLVFALEKADETDHENIRFMNVDASSLNEIFEPGTFEEIYINFCDPWPKKRHTERRLTYSGFLLKFKELLKDDGHICFKTDNTDLFDFSIPEFEKAGFDVSCVTYDLHNSEWAGVDTETEYEHNFSEKGVPIKRLVAEKKKG